MAVEGTRRAENWATISGDRATPANRKCQAPRFPPERNPINPRPTGTRRANFWFYPRRVHFLSRFTAFRSSFTGFRLGSTGYLFLTKPHRDRLEYKEQQKQKFSLKKTTEKGEPTCGSVTTSSGWNSTSVGRWVNICFSLALCTSSASRSTPSTCTFLPPWSSRSCSALVSSWLISEKKINKIESNLQGWARPTLWTSGFRYRE